MEMKHSEKIRIRIGDRRVVTLAELYQEYENSHRIQAGLPFEDKIRALVELQKLAVTWGQRQDVIIWIL